MTSRRPLSSLAVDGSAAVDLLLDVATRERRHVPGEVTFRRPGMD